MEGIIAKRKDSIYRPGKRSSDWLKIKARLQQEFVVAESFGLAGSVGFYLRSILALLLTHWRVVPTTAAGAGRDPVKTTVGSSRGPM